MWLFAPHLTETLFPTKCTNFSSRDRSQIYTEIRLFKMGTHRRFRPCHKAFKMTSTKKSFLKNVTMKCFMAQSKLPSHVEEESTKRSNLQQCCTLFRNRLNFCTFLKQFNLSCTVIKYFRAGKCLNISVLSQAITV